MTKNPNTAPTVAPVVGWPEQLGQAELDRLSELETAVLRLLADVDALKRRKDKPPVDLSNPDCIAWKNMPKRWQKKMKRHSKAGGKVQYAVVDITDPDWLADDNFDPAAFKDCAYRAAP